MRDTTDELDLRALARAAFAKAETEEIPLPAPGAKAPAVTGAARYELLGALAQGTFGVVHEARDKATGERVAIKVLRASSGPEAVARFEREAQAARRLEHPGIARVLDVGVTEGMPFIAFELVRGKSLEETVAGSGPLAEDAALGLVGALARALAHAHERGVLHRDVSPANVLLSERGPVLIDFGLAKDLLASEALTRTGDVLGTVRFMAPELLAGQARRADERADVFGLGAVLHFALTGEPPFAAASAVELAREMEKTPPPPPGASARVAALLARLLAPRPESRPASVKAVLEILEAPTLASPIRASVPAPRRWPSLWVLGAVLAFVAALGGLALVRRAQRAEALAIVAAAEGSTPVQQEAAAASALTLASDLEEGFALRALAHARKGELPAAGADLEAAGKGPLARRARGWVLFRSGHEKEGLALVAGTPDEERLAVWSGQREAPRALAAQPWFQGEDALCHGELRRARAILEPVAEPGTLDGAESLLLLARIDAVLLDENDMARVLALLRESPPRERSLAESFEAQLRGGEKTQDPFIDVDDALAREAREEARVELADYELTARESDLAGATRRLRRSLSFGGRNRETLALLARALGHRARDNDAELRGLAKLVGGAEAARTFLLLGDREELWKALGDGGAGDTLARDVAAIAAGDGTYALRRFVEGGDPADGEVALRALEKLVRGEPTAALTELEYLEKGRSTIELARARFAQDPIGSLECLVRCGVVSGEALVLSDALAASLAATDVRGALEARALSADQVERGLALVGPQRARLFQIQPPPATFQELEKIARERNLDAILLHRDPGLVRYRTQPGWPMLLTSR